MSLEDFTQAIETRNVAKVKSLVGRISDKSILEYALYDAISKYMNDVSNPDISYMKQTLEIINIFVENRVSTSSPEIWDMISNISALNPYVRTNRNKIVPLIVILSQNLDMTTERGLFDMTRDILEESMTPEEISQVIAHPSALKYMPQFSHFLPEGLLSAWNRRKHAVAARKEIWGSANYYMPLYQNEETGNNGKNNGQNGGIRRRRKTQRRNSKKRKTMRRRK